MTTKNFTIVILATFVFGVAQAQQSTWLFDKSIKTTSFLGQGIASYDSKNREIKPDQTSECNGVSKKIDTAKIQNSEITEYQYKSREFFMSFFSASSIKVTDVKMYNPIEYTLDFETVKKMPKNEYFVYAGQSADSVEFQFSFSRKTNTDISAALTKISSVLTAAGVNMATINNYIPLFDSTQLNTLDTLRFKYMLRDPNAIFRVQVIKKKSTRFDPSGNDYRLYFPPLTSTVTNIPDTTIMEFGKVSAITQPETPRFGWLTPENSNVAFKLKLDKANNQLRLGVEFVDGVTKSVYFNTQDNGTNNFWQETTMIYSFRNSNVRKLVYVSIFAEQISPTQVRVINKLTTNGVEAKVTYMSYPEIKLKYLK